MAKTACFTLNTNDWEVREVAGTDEALAAPRTRETAGGVVLFELPAGSTAEQAREAFVKLVGPRTAGGAEALLAEMEEGAFAEEIARIAEIAERALRA
jgi:hypothetical protein